nr:NADH dehydrogenase subunit 5 [Euapta godeffroyi]
MVDSFISSLTTSLFVCIFMSIFYSRIRFKGSFGLSENEISVLVLKLSFLSGVGLVFLNFFNSSTGLSLGEDSIGSLSLFFSLNYDTYFIFFLLVGSFVTYSIMEFSYYYMSEDPFSVNFYRLLMLFLLNMLLLTCSDSLFVLFIGWEGVGVLSFLLIGWWKSRLDAQSASLQAIIYNRVGDLGVILMIFFFYFSCGSMSLQDLYLLAKISDFNLFLFFGLLAACGKSSQFLFHPWLPSAMEGPTPVSALLHSSTMVVAGVFLLVRLTSFCSSYTFFNSVCLFIGGLTSLYAASVALFQYDIKKIIAYSTTSQLGLMFCSIGLGSPFLAFFHICTHAFFKAMLFMCSGSVIHSLGNEQDLRKMGSTSSMLPITYSCIVLGSVALAGFPFLSGFYSKDLILESVSLGSINVLSIFFLFIASMLTSVYSVRLILLCSNVMSNTSNVNPVSEESTFLTGPILRLCFGSVVFGWLGVNFLYNLDNFFVSELSKVIPLVFMFIGLFGFLSGVVYFVYSSSFYPYFYFLVCQWNYSYIGHFLLSVLSKTTSFVSGYFIDLRYLSKVPVLLGLSNIKISGQYSELFHSSTVKIQVLFLVGAVLLITLAYYLFF